MKKYKHHLLIKLLLVLVSEALAVIIVGLISRFVVPLPHTGILYVVLGAVLAVIIVSSYNRWLNRRKEEIKEELQDLNDAVLLRYDEITKKNDTTKR